MKSLRITSYFNFLLVKQRISEDCLKYKKNFKKISTLEKTIYLNKKKWQYFLFNILLADFYISLNFINVWNILKKKPLVISNKTKNIFNEKTLKK